MKARRGEPILEVVFPVDDLDEPLVSCGREPRRGVNRITRTIYARWILR